MSRKLPDDFSVPIHLAKRLAETSLAGTVYSLLERAYIAGWNAGLQAAEERFIEDLGYKVGEVSPTQSSKDLLKCIADLELNYPLQLGFLKVDE